MGELHEVSFQSIYELFFEPVFFFEGCEPVFMSFHIVF